MTDTVKVLSDDERLAQIRERQDYRSEWAYGDDIEFLLGRLGQTQETLTALRNCQNNPCRHCAALLRVATKENQ